jgi:hypothetical protein
MATQGNGYFFNQWIDLYCYVTHPVALTVADWRIRADAIAAAAWAAFQMPTVVAPVLPTGRRDPDGGGAPPDPSPTAPCLQPTAPAPWT